jgi:hypothetical protein
MTILQMVLILAIFHRALRVPGEPDRDRERAHRPGRGDRVGS